LLITKCQDLNHPFVKKIFKEEESKKDPIKNRCMNLLGMDQSNIYVNLKDKAYLVTYKDGEEDWFY